MENDDFLEYNGTVVSMAHGDFLVEVPELGTTIRAKLAGSLRKNKIRVIVADEVKVAVSPYDFGRGRIVYRLSKGGLPPRR